MRNKSITQIIREQESMLNQIEPTFGIEYISPTVDELLEGGYYKSIDVKDPSDRTKPFGQRAFIQMLRKQREDDIKKSKNRMRRKMRKATQQKQSRKV